MMAPLNFSSPPKPKLAFSIDSIVGSSESTSPKLAVSQPDRGRSATPPSPVTVVSTPYSSGCSPVSSTWSSPPAAASQLPETTVSQFATLHHLHNARQLRAAADQMAAHPLLARASQLPGLPFLHGGMLPGQRPAAAAMAAAAAGLAPAQLMAAFPPHPHQMQQTEYPLLPWLHSRHGRLFPTTRFPGPDFPAFLLQPFRKPKRIRTAFSPSQLLKLEHAFEKNHYVVGQERKQLAQSLNLSETQVKVWFQNRRTKHKRVQEEDDTKDSSEKILLDDSSDQLLSYEKSDDEDNIDIDGDPLCAPEDSSPYNV